MIILPAIDILGGQCVRLVRGEYGSAQRVAADALETARSFAAAGAEYLHLVDLDGARDGKRVNHSLFQSIVSVVGIPVELGGGIRDMETVEYYLRCGISRVILGSAALHNPGFVREAVRHFGKKIAVGIDARTGKVSASGWTETSDTDYLTFASMMEDAGVGNIIFTDIDRDGTLEGPNLEQLAALCGTVRTDVTASGGIRDMEDIRRLSALGVYGAICGKSIYSGSLDLSEAVAYTKAQRRDCAI